MNSFGVTFVGWRLARNYRCGWISVRFKAIPHTCGVGLTIDRGHPSLLNADIEFDVSGRLLWLQRMAPGVLPDWHAVVGNQAAGKQRISLRSRPAHCFRASGTCEYWAAAM
jgi:hypothetical protein